MGKKMKKKKGIELIVRGFDDTTSYDQDELREKFDEFFNSVKSGDGKLDLIKEEPKSDFLDEIGGALIENSRSTGSSKFVASEHLDTGDDEDDDYEGYDEDTSDHNYDFYGDIPESKRDIDLLSSIAVSPFSFDPNTKLVNISSFYRNLSTVDFSRDECLRKDPDDFHTEQAEKLFDLFRKAFITIIPPTCVLPDSKFIQMFVKDFGKITSNAKIRFMTVKNERYYGITVFDTEAFYKNILEFKKFIFENHIVIHALYAIAAMVYDDTDVASRRSFEFNPDSDVSFYVKSNSDYNFKVASILYDYMNACGAEIHSEEMENLNPVDDYFTALVEKKLVILDTAAEESEESFYNKVLQCAEKINLVEDDDDDDEEDEELVYGSETDVMEEDSIENPEDEESPYAQKEPEEDYGDNDEDASRKEIVEKARAIISHYGMNQDKMADDINNAMNEDNSDDAGIIIDADDEQSGYSTMADALAASGIGGDSAPDDDMSFTPHRKRV